MNRFGVEFEYDDRLISQDALHQRMQQAFDEYYDALNHRIWRKGRSGSSSWGQNHSRRWTLKRDSSCGYEVTSKILQSTKAGITEIIRVAEILNAKYGKKFPTSSRRCGLHIHISKAGLTEANVNNFMRFLYLSSPVIHEMTRSEFRQTRVGCTYGRTRAMVGSSRRRFLFRTTRNCSLHSIRRHTHHRTMEIRLSKSLKDPQQIANYVQFLLTALSICKGLSPDYFKSTYKNDVIMRELFNEADIKEFFMDEQATHPWLEEDKARVLEELKII